MRAVTQTQETQFVKYCMDFHGPGGVYDYGFSEVEVEVALSYRLMFRPELAFEGDTADREIVREIVLDILREGK